MEFRVTGIKRQIKRMEKLKEFDLNMQEISVRALSDVQEHFKNEQGPRSGWAPIKREGKILRYSGQLVNSIQARHSKKTASVFTNKEYAAVHNFGFKKRNIKQRKFLWISKKAISDIKLLLAEQIIRLVR